MIIVTNSELLEDDQIRCTMQNGIKKRPIKFDHYIYNPDDGLAGAGETGG